MALLNRKCVIDIIMQQCSLRYLTLLFLMLYTNMQRYIINATWPMHTKPMHRGHIALDNSSILYTTINLVH